jgi:hypothetical protein
VNNLPFDKPGRFYKGNLHAHPTTRTGCCPPGARRPLPRGRLRLSRVTDHFRRRYGFPVTDTRPYRREASRRCSVPSCTRPSTGLGEDCTPGRRPAPRFSGQGRIGRVDPNSRTGQGGRAFVASPTPHGTGSPSQTPSPSKGPPTRWRTLQPQLPRDKRSLGRLYWPTRCWRCRRLTPTRRTDAHLREGRGTPSAGGWRCAPSTGGRGDPRGAQVATSTRARGRDPAVEWGGERGREVLAHAGALPGRLRLG